MTSFGETVERLALAGCVAPEEEAADLLVAGAGTEVPDSWVARREQGQPLEWITGRTLFCGLPLAVAPGVYVPRWQSEDLARRAAAALAAVGRGTAVDLCTGSGAIAAYLDAEVPDARVVGVDVDPRAVACAARNGVRAVQGDLAAPLRPGSADVVTAVAPYVPTAELVHLPRDVRIHEPRHALDGGPDGLRLVRRIVEVATRLLGPSGRLLLELGGDQDRAVVPLLGAAGFEVSSWTDADGDLRGVDARRHRGGG